MTEKKSYKLKCVFCGLETTANIKQSLKTKCLCMRTDTKYKLGESVNNRTIIGRKKGEAIVQCNDCNRVSEVKYAELTITLCICKQKRVPSFGKLNYDTEGKPICELCGLSFKKLGNHIRLVHGMLSEEYKEIFGLDRSQSLMCNESIELARKRNKENYELVVQENLLQQGLDSRFESGHIGRPKYMCREQTLIRLRK